MDFESHLALLMSQRFGMSDSYSYNLKKLGYDAKDIVTNDDILQLKWAQENGLRIKELSKFFLCGMPRMLGNNFGPKVSRLLSRSWRSNWRYRVLKAQVERMKPDIIYIQEGNILTDGFIGEMKSLVRYIVGQIASPIRTGYLCGRTFEHYDLVLSSFPHFVRRFRRRGIASEYLMLAFDERVLNQIGPVEQKFDITFVGGISRAHGRGYELLNGVSRQMDVDFFGYGKDHLPRSSPIRRRHHGEIWGLDMYRTLAQSYITLNRHIDVAENYANNMRLFEASGVGACLVTDWKENLHEMFESDKEVVTYKSADELVDKVRYLHENVDQRNEISRNGQVRTLRDHTYAVRMAELDGIFKKILKP